VGFGIVIPLLPFYVQSMGGSAEVIGILLGTFAFTQTVATPLLGRASDRWGRRPIIVASLAGNAIAMVLFAIAAEQPGCRCCSRRASSPARPRAISPRARRRSPTSRRRRIRAAGMGASAPASARARDRPVLGSAISHLHPNAPPLAAGALAFLDLLGVSS
jgi:MFS family permease